MKIVLLILVFFLFGVSLVLSYQYWTPETSVFTNAKPQIKTNFSLANAPSESLQGSIATMSGTVAWLSRDAAKPVQLRALRAIQQGEEVTTGANGNAIIRIKNDSILSLLPNTHVGIIQLLPQNFVFDQDKGTIRYQNTWQVPISVKSYDLITLITKGIVIISADPKEKTVSVKVEKGTVHEGYEDSQNNSTVVTVDAGQTFLFDETAKTGLVQ